LLGNNSIDPALNSSGLTTVGDTVIVLYLEDTVKRRERHRASLEALIQCSDCRDVAEPVLSLALHEPVHVRLAGSKEFHDCLGGNHICFRSRALLGLPAEQSHDTRNVQVPVVAVERVGQVRVVSLLNAVPGDVSHVLKSETDVPDAMSMLGVEEVKQEAFNLPNREAFVTFIIKAQHSMYMELVCLGNLKA